MRCSLRERKKAVIRAVSWGGGGGEGEEGRGGRKEEGEEGRGEGRGRRGGGGGEGEEGRGGRKEEGEEGRGSGRYSHNREVVGCLSLTHDHLRLARKLHPSAVPARQTPAHLHPVRAG